MASLANIYTHRKVADTAAKACEICYKPSTSVLVAPENKDFFYVCPAHLKDKGFCNAIIDEVAVAAKKKKEMEAEVERVKQEFEEKKKKKLERDMAKDKDKEKDKGKSDKTAAAFDEEPRVFALQKTFFQQRVDKKRNAEIAKRSRERLQNPNLFPQVPKGFP
ncbi:hypothetical protein B2J93_3264 [Marssonina coronariae]|uniref:DUF1742-domain-containing protein n=1 Tax=Diplocarpon coronariae TaxID=2795749 RepID=A0A218Z7X8_9HELO|nr:hypothetical protein B2J93_3264 [Marssonina coronariae]